MLIPAGARVLGAAAPVQAWGDARLAVSFHRLLMPDGHSYSLDLFKGLDAVGETGLRDRVDRHYAQVFGASLAIGALSGLAQFTTRAAASVLRTSATSSVNPPAPAWPIRRAASSTGISMSCRRSRFARATGSRCTSRNDLELPAYAAVPGGPMRRRSDVTCGGPARPSCSSRYW